MAAPKGNKFAVGNKGGAPEKYSIEWLKEEATLFLAWFDVPNNIYLKGFALERGYDPHRFSEFADKSEEFSAALRIAKQKQEYKMAHMSLHNQINPSMAKFLLANCHGMSEKTQVAGDALNPLSFILQRVDGDTKDLVNGK